MEASLQDDQVVTADEMHEALLGIGAVAGTWFQHNHLLGVAVAVGIALFGRRD